MTEGASDRLDLSDVSRLGAAALARHIASGKVSVRTAVEASLAAIDTLNPFLKAFITVDAERALERADRLDAQLATNGRQNLPPLFGVPVAIKDVTPTAGLRTTFGSRLHADNVPDRDALSVARLKDAGAVIIGKTNTPEFAFGARCSNTLYGPTATPWDLSRSSGGSSGGSAAAVSAGMVPLAMGTDFGGSVRTPASFCGCMSLRPTPGLIPDPTKTLGNSMLATEGILARESEDLALTLGCLAGYDPMDAGSRFASPEHAVPDVVRLARSATLGDAYPLDDDVHAAFDSACEILAATLGEVREDHPDVTGGIEAFKTMRAAESWFKMGRVVEQHEDLLTPSFVWNVRMGRDISAEAYLSAQAVQTRIHRTFQAFFENHDLLLVPAASILPFPNTQEEVTVVGGQAMETIIDYLAPTFLISLVGFPVLCFPALITKEGLPFGVQIIARPGEERLLIEAARRLEAAGHVHD